MRIGRTIIDLDNLTIEDLNTVIDEARRVRNRKKEAESYKLRMHALLAESREAGFDFIDKDLGFVIKAEDLELHDNH